MAYDSEDEFLAKEQPKAEDGPGWSPDSDYAAPKSALLDLANETGRGEAALVGIGKGMVGAGRGVKDAYYGVTRQYEKRAELQKRIKEEQEMFDNGLGSEFSKNRNWAKGGEFVGMAAPALVIPGGGATLGARAALQAGYGAGYNALTTSGSVGDRLQSGAVGAVGAGLGSAGAESVGKIFNATRGKWGNPLQKEVNDKLVSLGLRPTVGDLAGPNEAGFVKSVEDLFYKLSPGKAKLAEESEKLKRLIVPDKITGVNTVTEAVKGTSKAMGNVGNEIWSGFDNAITGNVSKVKPTSLKQSIDKIYNEYPQLFSQSVIPNKVLRDQLQEIIDTPANKLGSIPIETYNVLRKALGSVVADVKVMTTPVAAASNTRLPKQALGMVGDMLDGAADDMARWGNNGKNQKAYKLFQEADTAWKETVLPWRKSQLAQDLTEISPHGASTTAKRIAGEKDSDVVDQVRAYLKRYGGYDAADTVDALAVQRRAAMNMGDVSGGIPVPKIGVGVPTHRPSVKGTYFADGTGSVPTPLKMKGGSVRGALSQILRAGPVSLSRTVGQQEAAAMAGILDILKPLSNDKDDTESYSHGVGAATQQGVGGR